MDAVTPQVTESDKLPKDLKTPNTTSNLRTPWEYRSSFASRESRKAFERFCYYLGIQDGRTLSKVSIYFKVSLPTISIQATKGQWVTRAAAFDEFEALRRADEEREARHNTHLGKLETFRDRSENLGAGLIGAAAQLLQAANASILEMKKNGETLDRRLIASALNASAKCSESGRVLMAQSLGVDALLTGVDGAEGDADDFS
jgi:hypothetical protein